MIGRASARTRRPVGGRSARRSRTLLAVVVAALFLMSGCATVADEGTSIPISPSVSTPPLRSADPSRPLTAPADSRGPGGVVRVENPLQGVDPAITELGATVKRVVYRSTSGIDGAPTVVSGILVVPNGKAPAGGWPVVAFGHGNSGIRQKCAPSLYANMLGNAKILAAIVLNGYAVVMSDYQGLGQPGPPHPFLDGRTYGNNQIDLVRAARAIAPDRVSNRWISYGVSLGGLAAWAAGDRATQYGAGLSLLGTAALVPVADMTDLVDRAVNGTLTRDQYLLWLEVVESMSETYPSMNIEDYRSPFARRVWDTALDCLPIGNPSIFDVRDALQSLGPDDVRPKTAAAAEFVRSRLAQRAIPVGPNPAPTLVMYGTADQLVAPAWTERAIARSCADGAKLDVIKRVGETHSDLDSSQSVDFLNTVRSNSWKYDNCDKRP